MNSILKISILCTVILHTAEIVREVCDYIIMNIFYTMHIILQEKL